MFILFSQSCPVIPVCKSAPVYWAISESYFQPLLCEQGKYITSPHDQLQYANENAVLNTDPGII